MPHLRQNASNLPGVLIPKRHESRFFFIRDTVHTRGRCPRSHLSSEVIYDLKNRQNYPSNRTANLDKKS